MFLFVNYCYVKFRPAFQAIFRELVISSAGATCASTYVTEILQINYVINKFIILTSLKSVYG